MRAPEGFHHSKVSGIRINNVHVTNADSRYACLIAGVENHPVRKVRIKNLSVQFRGGLLYQLRREYPIEERSFGNNPSR
jgi:hypothetical protein